MPPTRPQYPPEFRAEAIRLVREGGRTPQQLAKDLGCTSETIRNWLKQAERDEGQRSDGLTSVEREELRRLRAENRVLGMERDLLKKRSCHVAAPRWMKMAVRRSVSELAAFWCREPDKKTELVAGRHHGLLPHEGVSTRGKVVS
jgi:transposase